MFKRLAGEYWVKFAACLVLVVLAWPVPAAALGSQQNPQSGSVGVEGKLSGPPPSTPPSIGVPSNGQSFGTIPITVSGLCKTGLLVKVFDNGVFVGSVVCTNGSFSIKISLFGGKNDLVAKQYDSLDQASPPSATVTVHYNDVSLVKFGTHVFLTSDYSRRGGNPGDDVTWPLILSGGVGPYAVSVDWGDGSPATLKSLSVPGTFTVDHKYTSAGTYNMLVRATDKNGTQAFLQLVVVVNGNAHQNAASTAAKNTPKSTTINIVWEPLAAAIPIILTTFWLGRRYEITALRKRIEQEYRA